MSSSKLSIGIVGLPNVGKSTLFNALTKQAVNAANYPFATIDPNVGVVAVPDERLHKLAAMSRSKKTIPAIVEFYDIAGLVRGAHEGEGLGNQFLSHIRETQAIVVVLRAFPDPAVIHVEGGPDPLRDLKIIEDELAFKDLETAEKALGKAESDAKSGEKEAVGARDGLRLMKGALEKGKPLFLDAEKTRLISANPRLKSLNLLTAKKQIYLINGREDDVPAELREKIKERRGEFIVADLSSGPNLSPLIGVAYKVLDLISFFTTGEDETRAWTIERGTKAPRAGSAIHGDFESKFIKAEVVGWQKLLDAGGWAKAREGGILRTEGKDYVVQDGDVVVFKHGQ